MPEYINADGSGLIGALNAVGVGQALLVDNNGYLRVTAASTTQAISDTIAPASVPETQLGIYNGLTIDRAQGLNGALSVQDWIRQLTLQGKGFTGTTGVINQAVGTYPLSIFNPVNSGKNVLIYSLRLASNSGFVAQVQEVTSNPAFAMAVPVTNMKLGGPTSAINTSCTFATTSQSIIGQVMDAEVSQQNGSIEMLNNGAVFLLPSGNGIIAYMTTLAAGYTLLNAKWIEF